MAGRPAKLLFDNHEATTILGVASLLPRWIAVLLYLPVFSDLWPCKELYHC